MKIYLDDDRTTPIGFERAISVQQLIDLCREHKVIDLVSLDNDLGYGQKEGYDFVKWYVNDGVREHIIIKSFNIHSQNIVAEMNMIGLLHSAMMHDVIKTGLVTKYKSH